MNNFPPMSFLGGWYFAQRVRKINHQHSHYPLKVTGINFIMKCLGLFGEITHEIQKRVNLSVDTAERVFLKKTDLRVVQVDVVSLQRIN